MTTVADSIKADPLATEEEIRALDDKDAVQHPSCPTGLWWDLVWKYPLEAEKSPLFPLLTLESPERWLALERDCIHDWIKKVVEGLNGVIRQQLFAWECASRVVHLFRPELAHPPEGISLCNLLREALRLRRTRPLAVGNGWDEWNERYYHPINEAKPVGVSYQVMVACTSSTPWLVCRAARHAVDQSTFPLESRPDAVLTEARWQWKRVQAYLAASEIPYPLWGEEP